MCRRLPCLVFVIILLCGAQNSGASWGLAGSSSSDTVSLFHWDYDTQSFVFSDPIDLGQYGNYPYDAVKRPRSDNEIWVPGAAGDGVVVIDETGVLVHEIPTHEYPVSIAFNPSEDIALVSCRDSECLDIIDTNTYEVVGSLDIPGLYQGPGNIVFDVRGQRFFLVSWYDDYLLEISADGTAIVDQVDAGTSLWQIAIDPNAGDFLYVTDRGTNQLRVLDPETLAEIQALDVGADPWGLDVDFGRVVVSCEDSGDVYIIETYTWDSQQVILPAGADPRDVSIASGLLSVAGRNLLVDVAYVAGGQMSGGDPMYVIDLYDGSIIHDLDVPGTNTNVVAVEAQWPIPSAVDDLPLAGFLPLVISPNPFNPMTQVKFQLETMNLVRVEVFDISGRLVRTLHDGMLDAGPHQISWDGRDQSGRVTSSGSYVVQIKAGQQVGVEKVILIK